MTLKDKENAIRELEDLVSEFSWRQGLPEWINRLRKTVWKYFPDNDIADDVEKLFYDKKLREDGKILSQSGATAQNMIRQLIQQLKATRDIVS